MKEKNTSKNINMFVSDGVVVGINPTANVVTFQVCVDENILKSVKYEIDKWSGMGELKYAISCDVRAEYQVDGQDVQVVSCYPYSASKNMCDFMKFYYEFYQFVPCELSKLCSDIMRDLEYLKPLEFSEHMACLLKWPSKTANEAYFVEKILSAFEFSRVTEVKTEISEKIGFLKRLKSIFVLDEYVGNQTYDEAISSRIRLMEADVTAKHRKELRGDTFRYDYNERRFIKREILRSLPKMDQVLPLLEKQSEKSVISARV